MACVSKGYGLSVCDCNIWKNLGLMEVSFGGFVFD